MKKLKSWFLKLKPYCNKYVITVTILFIVIVFPGENSVRQRINLDREIGKLKREIRQYEQLRDESNRKLKALTEGTEELERIAREEYLMKKENEDIYLIQ
jgi:cell division protein FtsB